MWKPISLVLIGLVAGWLLHEYLAPRTVILSEQEYSWPPPITDAPIPDILELLPVPELVEQRADPVQDEAPTSPDALLAGISETLEQGNHIASVELCINAPAQYIGACRNALLEYAESPDKLPDRAVDLLEQWLLEVPDDIDAGIILVELLVSDEQYVEAARRLALLKSYLVDPGSLERVARTVRSVARPAIIKLTLTDDRTGLESLLKILVEMEPERATWHYSLAKVQYDLQKYDAAINTLSYILFDPEYGDRAAQMHDEISKKLDLADYYPVPLVASGSHFLVNARLNGSREIKLLLDTGASITSIDQNVLRRLGIESHSGRPIALRTANGMVSTRTTLLKYFDVGGYSVRGMEVAVLDFSDSPADGLLGMNFLDHFRFILDQKQRKLFLTPR